MGSYVIDQPEYTGIYVWSMSESEGVAWGPCINPCLLWFSTLICHKHGSFHAL